MARWTREQEEMAARKAAVFWLKSSERVIAHGGNPARLSSQDRMVLDSMDEFAEVYGLEWPGRSAKERIKKLAVEIAMDYLRNNRYPSVAEHFSSVRTAAGIKDVSSSDVNRLLGVYSDYVRAYNRTGMSETMRKLSSASSRDVKVGKGEISIVAKFPRGGYGSNIHTLQESAFQADRWRNRGRGQWEKSGVLARIAGDGTTIDFSMSAKMKGRMSSELVRIAADLKPYLDFRIVGIDPKKADFANRVVCDIEDLAELVRRNEGLEMEMTINSKDDEMAVHLAMEEHKAIRGIIEKMRHVVDKGARKHKLTIEYGKG